MLKFWAVTGKTVKTPDGYFVVVCRSVWLDRTCALEFLFSALSIIAANNVDIMFTITLGQLLLITMATEVRQAMYSNTGLCSTDAPATVKTLSRIRCSTECLHLTSCRDFNHNSSNNECSLFRHKPLFNESKAGCAGFKARQFVILSVVITSNLKIYAVISVAQSDNMRSVRCSVYVFKTWWLAKITKPELDIASVINNLLFPSSLSVKLAMQTERIAVHTRSSGGGWSF